MRQITSPPQDLAEVIVNHDFATLEHATVYGNDGYGSSGLVRAYYGGQWGSFTVADATHTFGASTTTYVSVNRSDGTLDFSTSNTHFTDTANYATVEIVVTGASQVSSVTNRRGGPGGVHGQVATSTAVDIHGATAKTSLVDADETALADSAASYAFKKITWANVKATMFAAWGALINGGTSKATPVDADAFALMDSAASNVTKKLTWANLKATIKTYADTLYQPLSSNLTTLAGFTTDTDTTLAANSDTRLATQKAVRGYVDSAIDGRAWKQPVRFRTTANVSLSGGGLAAGTTHDGVTAVAGDRVLVPSQTSGAENGIYVVPASGAASRSSDADSAAEVLQATVVVEEGTTYADTQWTCSTNAPITLGTTALTFVQTNTSTTYSADESTLHLAGNTFSIKGLGVSTSELAADAVTNAKLANMAASTIKARKTASTGDPEDCTLSEVLDFIGSAAQGDILYRGASAWARLGAGTSGQYLQTQGAGANPQWAAGSSGGADASLESMLGSI